MNLHERIIAYVEKHYPLSMTVLEGIVLSKGFTIEQFYSALEKVHRDKRIIQTQRGGEVWYSIYIAPEIKPQTHVEWITKNYPWPENFKMPFPEIDMDYLFLKTREDRDAYKAMLRGVSYIPKKTYEHTRRENPARNPEALTRAQRALLASTTAYL